MSTAVQALEGLLPRPGLMLEAIVQRKHEWEERSFRKLFAAPRRAHASHERAEQVRLRALRQELSASANFLELCLLAVGYVEAAHLLGATTLEAPGNTPGRLLELCASVTGLDPTLVIQRNRGLLTRKHRQQEVPLLAPLEEILAAMVRFALSVTAACPIHTLESWGHELDAALLSHRCRKAYEGLSAFARRHTSEIEEQTQTVGRAYSEGRLTLEDVSRILQVPLPDAVALLERYSFCRPPSALRLKPEQRRLRLQSIAQEVQAAASQGGSLPPADLLDRDVIASQRIEGVDARPWVTLNKG